MISMAPDTRELLAAIPPDPTPREAYQAGWQKANHAWQNWLDKNIPNWDAMADVDLASLPSNRGEI